MKSLMVGYLGGALIFAGCLIVILTNVIGLTWIEIPAIVIIGSVTLMMGSKLIAGWLHRRQEAKHG